MKVILSLIAILSCIGFPEISAASTGPGIFAASVGQSTAKWGNTFSFTFFNGRWGVSLYGSTNGQISSADVGYYPYPGVNTHYIGEKTIDPMRGGEILAGASMHVAGLYFAPIAGIGAAYYEQGAVYEDTSSHLLYVQKTSYLYRLSASIRFLVGPESQRWVVGAGYNNLRGGFVTVGIRY